ncbi:hypothetical protein CK203_111915 [Vitis vinifera]|uniref:Uncharacterized protein n=1 Tax=Vitis vinifera TaxID=29760 RepID=A0A438CFL9_VITVI|nr:hypothetical protein CK203_111915 [Vitis vinifera]
MAGQRSEGEAGSGVFRWLWRRIKGVGAEQDLAGKSFPRPLDCLLKHDSGFSFAVNLSLLRLYYGIPKDYTHDCVRRELRLVGAFGFDAYNPMEIALALEPKAKENGCPSTVLADSLKASSSSLSWSSQQPGLFSAPPLPLALATRLIGGVESKPKSSFSSSGISNREPLSRRIFQSPVEMGCYVESRFPFHAAMASALFNSMLSVSHHSYGWAPEVCNVDMGQWGQRVGEGWEEKKEAGKERRLAEEEGGFFRERSGPEHPAEEETFSAAATIALDSTVAAIARDSAAVFAWKGEILQELFSCHRGPRAVHQAWRIRDPEHRCRVEVAKV